MAVDARSVAWRRWFAAAVEAGFAIGLADASVAMSRVGERLVGWRDRVLFAVSLAGLCALAVGALALVACAALGAASRLRPSLRPRAVQLVATGVGIAAGFALFSGAAIRRSPARPWAILATAALAALLAQIAWSSRGRLADAAAAHPAALRAALASGSVALYLVHAFAYVRLYPGLHAFAALGAIALLVQALGWRTAPRERAPDPAFPVALFALVVGTLGGAEILHAGSHRSLARAQAPLGTYLVQALGRLAPARHVDAVVRDDRVARGRSFDLRGLDVVLVTVDALRADRLGAYGSSAGLTPALDAMARQAIVVDRAYCTAPHTSYSLASLMTSKYVRQLALLGLPLRSSATLAGELGRVGYATAAFYPPAVWSVDGDAVGDLRARAFDFALHREGYEDAAARVAQVERFLDEHPAPRRVFVWVHLFEPHEPYESHPAARCCAGDSPQDRYASEVVAVDDAIGRLRAAFAARGRRAAWIVTADHGEEFGEHGGRFHGTTVYDEQARVPLLLEVPGAPVGRQPGPASLVDVMPTVLAGLGIARPPRLRGRDLGPMVFGDERWDGAVYASAGSSRMIVRGHDKLVCDVSDGTCELYDLSLDAGERTNLIDGRATEASTLRGLLEGWQGSQERFEREAGERRAPIAAALARALQGDATVAPDVAALLDGADGETAQMAARALATLGSRDARVLDALARLQLRPDHALAIEAGVDLARLGDVRGAPAAREALGSTDATVARRGALALATLGSGDGVPVLCAWLADPAATSDARDGAVDALERLRDRRAISTWIALLDDARLAPRAADALGVLGDAAAVPALEHSADTTRYALTRRAALGALARLAPAAARARLVAALGAPDLIADPFGLATALGEPGARVAGTSQPTVLGTEHAVRVVLAGPRATGPVRLVIAGSSPRDGVLVVDDRASVPVARGTFLVTVALPRIGRAFRVAGPAGTVLARALVAPRGP